MRRIKLKGAVACGRYALVDNEDYHTVSPYRWYAYNSGRGHIYARTWDSAHRGRTLFMHRLILGLTYRDGIGGDHRNGNGLDNRRVNIRRATRSVNQLNLHAWRGEKTSRQIGVGWNPQAKKWVARAMIGGKRYYLGGYRSERMAIRSRVEFVRAYMALPGDPGKGY